MKISVRLSDGRHKFTVEGQEITGSQEIVVEKTDKVKDLLNKRILIFVKVHEEAVVAAPKEEEVESAPEETNQKTEVDEKQDKGLFSSKKKATLGPESV